MNENGVRSEDELDHQIAFSCKMSFVRRCNWKGESIELDYFNVQSPSI